MGKVKTNVAFKSFRNNIDGIVYYERYGEPCVMVPRKPSNPNTPKQRRVREAIRRLIALWKQLDGVVKESWRSHGQRTHISGYFAFVADNAVKQRDGLPLVFCREYGMEGLAEFSAKAGDAAGTVVCEYSAGETGDDFPVYLFAQKVEKKLAGGELRKFDGGAASGGSFVLTGLEPGAEYHVYALLVDAVYDEASMASESSSAACRAGGQG
jgi:hypothetical protein